MLTARDVMTTEVTTVRQDQPVEELIHLFRVSHFTGVPVVDEEGRAVGVVSETDILRALAYTIAPPTSGEHRVDRKGGGRQKGATARLLRPSRDPAVQHTAKVMQALVQRQVRDLMTPVVHSCKPSDPLWLVCETMTWKEVHRLVVVDEDDKVVGLISALDAVRQYGEDLRAAAKANGEA